MKNLYLTFKKAIKLNPDLAVAQRNLEKAISKLAKH